jgi:hypothetical protein
MKKRKCKKSIFYRIWHWYIKGEYHCDKCPYSWAEKTSYEYDEWDAGCYIKGDIHDTCRLLPPFRWIVGSLRKKKAMYYYNHQYDGCGEFYEEWENKNKKIQESITKFLDGYDLCWKDSKGEYTPINKEWHITQEAYRIRCDYEDYLGELEAKKNPPQKQNPWKQAIVWTWNKFINFFKPYFCK